IGGGVSPRPPERGRRPLLVVPLMGLLDGPSNVSLVLDLEGRPVSTVPGLCRAESVDVDGDGRGDLFGPVRPLTEPLGVRRLAWPVIGGWAPGLLPRVAEGAEGEDPRRRVPLPFARNFFLGMLQDGLPPPSPAGGTPAAGQARGPGMLVVMLPIVLLAV